MQRARTAILIALVGSAYATEVRASEDAARAEALFTSAKEAMSRGDLATACAEFAQSEQLDSAPGTLLNLGECEEKSGKLADAYAHFQVGLRALAAGDFRIEFVDERLAALDKRLPRLMLKVATPRLPGERITCDGLPLDESALASPLRIDPGAHVVRVGASGRQDARTFVTLHEGEGLTLEIAPGPAQDGSTQRTLGLVLGAAGALGVAIGTIFGIESKLTYDQALKHCPLGFTQCDGQGIQGGAEAHSQAGAATTLWILGGLFLGGGAALFFTAPSAPHRIAVGASVGPGVTGVRIGGAW